MNHRSRDGHIIRRNGVGKKKNEITDRLVDSVLNVLFFHSPSAGSNAYPERGTSCADEQFAATRGFRPSALQKVCQSPSTCLLLTTYDDGPGEWEGEIWRRFEFLSFRPEVVYPAARAHVQNNRRCFAFGVVNILSLFSPFSSRQISQFSHRPRLH